MGVAEPKLSHLIGGFVETVGFTVIVVAGLLLPRANRYGYMSTLSLLHWAGLLGAGRPMAFGASFD